MCVSLVMSATPFQGLDFLFVCFWHHSATSHFGDAEVVVVILVLWKGLSLSWKSINTTLLNSRLSSAKSDSFSFSAPVEHSTQLHTLLPEGSKNSFSPGRTSSYCLLAVDLALWEVSSQLCAPICLQP